MNETIRGLVGDAMQTAALAVQATASDDPQAAFRHLATTRQAADSAAREIVRAVFPGSDNVAPKPGKYLCVQYASWRFAAGWEEEDLATLLARSVTHLDLPRLRVFEVGTTFEVEMDGMGWPCADGKRLVPIWPSQGK